MSLCFVRKPNRLQNVVDPKLFQDLVVARLHEKVASEAETVDAALHLVLQVFLPIGLLPQSLLQTFRDRDLDISTLSGDRMKAVERQEHVVGAHPVVFRLSAVGLKHVEVGLVNRQERCRGDLLTGRGRGG